MQFHISRNDQRVFQVTGDFVFSGAGTHNVLHVKNTDETRKLYFTYIRVQSIDNGTIPAADIYFQIGKGLTYSSGGTLIAPVNSAFDSGNAPGATVYDNNPTLTGTFVEIDRFYPDKNGGWVAYNKEGAVRLGVNDTLTIRYVTAGTAGIAYARATFFFEVG
jgi:hypothetical protein